MNRRASGNASSSAAAAIARLSFVLSSAASRKDVSADRNASIANGRTKSPIAAQKPAEASGATEATTAAMSASVGAPGPTSRSSPTFPLLVFALFFPFFPRTRWSSSSLSYESSTATVPTPVPVAAASCRRAPSSRPSLAPSSFAAPPTTSSTNFSVATESSDTNRAAESASVPVPFNTGANASNAAPSPAGKSGGISGAHSHHPSAISCSRTASSSRSSVDLLTKEFASTNPCGSSSVLKYSPRLSTPRRRAVAVVTSPSRAYASLTANDFVRPYAVGCHAPPRNDPDATAASFARSRTIEPVSSAPAGVDATSACCTSVSRVVGVNAARTAPRSCAVSRVTYPAVCNTPPSARPCTNVPMRDSSVLDMRSAESSCFLARSPMRTTPASVSSSLTSTATPSRYPGVMSSPSTREKPLLGSDASALALRSQ